MAFLYKYCVAFYIRGNIARKDDFKNKMPLLNQFIAHLRGICGSKKLKTLKFDASAVQEISGEETEAKVIGNYSIDSKRLAQPLNGLNLQKLSNGKTIKIINR